jgi:hypothetical protein
VQKYFCLVYSFILLLSASNGLSAENKMHACSLLTSDEIGSAMGGGQVGQSQESDIVIPKGPSKGKTMGVCMWPIHDRQGMVSVNIIPVPQGAQRAEGLAKLKEAFEMLKAKGWTEEKKEFGNTECVIMTPPSSEKNVPILTTCIGETKGMGISVGSMSRKKLSIEKVKMLLDKVIGRIH